MLQKYSLWKVFREFLENPTKKHHIRRISAKIGLATTSVKNHIIELEKEGMVIEGKDTFKFYEADFENDRFRFYKKINSLESIEVSGLLDYIEEKTGAEVIYLFGSVAKGEDTSLSDIDLYVQSPETPIVLSGYEKVLGKKIQLHFSENFDDLPKELRNNIINGIRLRGYLKVF
jgi:predicted nucleotidyltransferase